MKAEMTLKITVSDLLFFWLMSTNENGPAEECFENPPYYIDTFAFSSRGQDLTLEAIHDADAQDEYEKVCDEVNKRYKLFDRLEIWPEHPMWAWEDVITYDSMSFERFVETQK